MNRRLNIVIAEPSEILRGGVVSILKDSDSISCNLAEVVEIASLIADIKSLTPDILILSPQRTCDVALSSLREISPEMKIIALLNNLYDQATLRSYDASISIYDSSERICSTIENIINNESRSDGRNELTPREREIVVCIAKGMTNKEIADTLFLSTHTVISHRRNITSKLEINSSSGLTIYAIVNGLIEVN